MRVWTYLRYAADALRHVLIAGVFDGFRYWDRREFKPREEDQQSLSWGIVADEQVRSALAPSTPLSC